MKILKPILLAILLIILYMGYFLSCLKLTILMAQTGLTIPQATMILIPISLSIGYITPIILRKLDETILKEAEKKLSILFLRFLFDPEERQVEAILDFQFSF